MDTYSKPKTIVCLHTFCCEYLKRHALNSSKQVFYRFLKCRAQIGIPEEKRFDNLPSSFLHNSLLILLAIRRSSEGNEISCSMPEEERCNQVLLWFREVYEPLLYQSTWSVSRYFVSGTQSHTSTSVSSHSLRALVEKQVILLWEVPREW